MYKSRKKAAMMSLILPGLGDLYLGHRLFGSLELIGSIAQWIALITFTLSWLKGAPDALFFLIFTMFLIVVTNVLDYFLTLAMASKGLIKSGQPNPEFTVSQSSDPTVV